MNLLTADYAAFYFRFFFYYLNQSAIPCKIKTKNIKKIEGGGGAEIIVLPIWGADNFTVYFSWN